MPDLLIDKRVAEYAGIPLYLVDTLTDRLTRRIKMILETQDAIELKEASRRKRG